MTESAPLAEVSPDFPHLNPELDRAAIAREFAARGRIQIQNVLTRASAQRIHRCMAEETDYVLNINGVEGGCDLAHLTPEQRREQTRAAWRRVGMNEFQFVYEMHVLTNLGEPYRDPAHYWASVTAFLEGPEFLGFAREVTGIGRIEFADAQATVYRGGHFLTAHDDDQPGPKRLVAYVLSFTPAWRPEWGGLLEFLGKNGQVEEGYVPNFNSLRLFSLPAAHYVSYVAPYAMAGRYSITGWLRAR